MAKKPELTDLTSQYGAQSVINSNNTLIEASFENTLSRDGSAPNQMEADFDLNSNNMLNVGTIEATNLTLNGQTVTALSAVPDWKGSWVTSTSYVLNDIASREGSTYICVEAHTSGTFSTDLSMGKWEVLAQKGAAGDGTGDMVGSNNLSDVTDAATARSNISAQQSSATLTSLASSTAAFLNLSDDADVATMRNTLGLGELAVLDESDISSSAMTRVEIVEPTSDSTELTFSTDLSLYRNVKIRGVLKASTTSAGSLQMRSGGGSWVTVLPISVNSVNPTTLFLDLYNTNNSDGSDLMFVKVFLGYETTTVADFRTTPFIQEYKTGGRTATTTHLLIGNYGFDSIRLNVTNGIKGVDADERAFFSVFGLEDQTGDVT